MNPTTMKNNFKHSINFIGAQIAITSLITGTICLLLFKNNGDTGLVAIGHFLVILAGIANTIMLPPMLINAIRRFKDYKENLVALLLLLINIPIAGLYLEIL